MVKLAGVLVVQNNEYVLQHRDNLPNIAEPGKYSVWGGTLENDETPVQGAVRELFEETGLSIDPDRLTELTNYETIATAPRVLGSPVRIWLYALELTSSEEVFCHEGQGIVRFAVDTYDTSNMTEFLVRAIQSYEATTR